MLSEDIDSIDRTGCVSIESYIQDVLDEGVEPDEDDWLGRALS